MLRTMLLFNIAGRHFGTKSKCEFFSLLHNSWMLRNERIKSWGASSGQVSVSSPRPGWLGRSPGLDRPRASSSQILYRDSNPGLASRNPRVLPTRPYRTEVLAAHWACLGRFMHCYRVTCCDRVVDVDSQKCSVLLLIVGSAVSSKLPRWQDLCGWIREWCQCYYQKRERKYRTLSPLEF